MGQSESMRTRPVLITTSRFNRPSGSWGSTIFLIDAKEFVRYKQSRLPDDMEEHFKRLIDQN